MAKYFVHEGLQFETIEVAPASIGQSGNMPINAVTLQSVAEALGSSADNTNPGVLAGADADARLSTLKGYWSTTGITDQYLNLIKELLDERAEVFPNKISGVNTDSSVMADFHKLSASYILPIGISNAMANLPATTTDAGRTAARNRLVVKSLEVDHTNIIKHGTQAEAREAWVAYTLASTDGEQQLARQGYLVNA